MDIANFNRETEFKAWMSASKDPIAALARKEWEKAGSTQQALELIRFGFVGGTVRTVESISKVTEGSKMQAGHA